MYMYVYFHLGGCVVDEIVYLHVCVCVCVCVCCALLYGSHVLTQGQGRSASE